MISIPIEPHNELPMYAQIYAFIRREILSDTLTTGTKLPSSRALASFHQISRNTVDIAYAQLECEGYIISKPRKGFFVNSLQYHFTMESAKPLLPQEKPKKNIYQYNFSPDEVDLSPFPYTIWKRLSNEAFQNKDLFVSGDNQGELSLRQQIATYLHGSRGVKCDPRQIIIGAGVDYLIQLLAQILDSNKGLAMESPRYPQAEAIFRGYGYLINSIPLDNKGLLVEQLTKSEADYCYVTPSHQYPTGVIMPISRRQTLMHWAKEKEHRYIIEDDYDSEFRYKGKPVPSLQSIDNDQRVIYLGTFSKSITPAIRVGYLILPTPLLDIYEKKYSFYSCTVSKIDQFILERFLSEGYFEKHLNRMRKCYKQKCDAALCILRQHTDLLTILESHSGLGILIQLVGDRLEPEAIYLQRAKEHQIQLVGLKDYYETVPADYKPTFLIGFGQPPIDTLQEGLTILCQKVFA